MFVVGFPLDRNESPNSLPSYKAASIASEPNFLGQRPYIFIDGKTKPGMSGSPVILAHEPRLTMDGAKLSHTTGITELIGVYSGREAEASTPFEAELGLMWPFRDAIAPILESI